MTTLATAPGRPAIAVEQREVVYVTSGRSAGPVVRLVSPSDVGERIKPFVFLDHFDFNPSASPAFGIHPHSGIATLTLLLGGKLAITDTIGKPAVVEAGGLEWMRASGGAWHDGAPVGTEPIRGLQLWLAMPPRFENAEPASQYISPHDVPRVGPVTVVLGQYGGAFSPIAAPGSATYLYVQLKKGERWTYTPKASHTVAWSYAAEGAVRTSGHLLHRSLAVYEESDASIEFIAESDAGFVVASATKHPHPLVLGYYSVHTSVDALEKGEAQIARIGTSLRQTRRQSIATP